jgi:Tfp pilus assembly protein PilP
MMMTNTFTRVTGLALMIGFVAPWPGLAQAQQAPPAPAPSAAGPTRTAPPEQEGFTYRAEGRRDPFLSLVRRGTEGQPASKRVEGLAGLAVADITLKGVLATRGSFVGLVQGPDTKTYVVHANDRLLDGIVKLITADSIVIVQDVNDPLLLTKQREIRKTLRVAEEIK